MAPVPASSDDIPSLLALTKACVARMRELGIDQWDDFYPDETLIAADVASGTVHVLKQDGELIGCVTVDEKADPNWQGLAWTTPDDGAAAVHRLMIDPSHQRRGLAKHLMLHAEAIAKANGQHTLRLDAFTLNPPSLRLYASLGYTRTGTAQMRKGAFLGFEKVIGLPTRS
jgi:ribosomal protein S18 acetylase RimI-like enzyme